MSTNYTVKFINFELAYRNILGLTTLTTAVTVNFHKWNLQEKSLQIPILRFFFLF